MSRPSQTCAPRAVRRARLDARGPTLLRAFLRRPHARRLRRGSVGGGGWGLPLLRPAGLEQTVVVDPNSPAPRHPIGVR